MNVLGRYKRAATAGLLLSLVLVLGYASVGFAALTFNATTVTSDGALTLTGSGASTWDIGTGALSIQTTNNGAVTFGTGLVTTGGRLAVGASSSFQGFTFTTATGTTLNVTGTATIGTVIATTLTSSTGITFTNATGSGSINIGTLTATTLLGTNTSSTGITFTNATGTNLTITTLVPTNVSFTNATGTSLNVTNASTTGFNFTNATGTNLGVSVIDNSAAITIGGTNGTELQLGRSGQWARFLGNASTTGSLAIATSGTPITQHYSATASVGFGTIASSSCTDVSVAVTKVAVNDTVVATNSSSSVEAGIFWSHYISAADIVKLRGCNLSTTSTIAHTTSTFRFDIWKH